MRANLFVSSFVLLGACTGPAGKMGDPGEPGSDSVGTGPAGGALTGTYPNPDIAAGAIGPEQFGTIPSVEAATDNDIPIPSAAVTKIALSGTTYDTASMFDAAAPTKLTAPIDGIYLITAGVKWRANGSGTQRFATIRDKNGEDIGITQVAPVNSGTNFTSEIVSVQVPLAKNDFVEFSVLQDSGVTVNLVNGLRFQMTWVAPHP